MRRLLCVCLCLGLLMTASARADGILNHLSYFGTAGEDTPVGLCCLADGRLAAGYNDEGGTGHVLVGGMGDELSEQTLPGPLIDLCAFGDGLALLWRDEAGKDRLDIRDGRGEPLHDRETVAPFAASGVASLGDGLAVCGSSLRAEGDTCGVVGIYDSRGCELGVYCNDVVSASGFTCIAPTKEGYVVGGWKETEAGRAALLLFHVGSIVRTGETTSADYRVTGEHEARLSPGDGVYARVLPCAGGALAVGSFAPESGKEGRQALLCRADADGRERFLCVVGGPQDDGLTGLAAFESGWIAVGMRGDAPDSQGAGASRAWLYPLKENGAGGRDLSIWLEENAAFSHVLARDGRVLLLGSAAFDSPFRAESQGGVGGTDIFLAELSPLQLREFRNELQ